MVYMRRDLRIPVRIPKNSSRFIDAESGRSVRKTLQNAFIAGFANGEIREGIIRAGKECTCKREGTIYDEGKKNVQFRKVAEYLSYGNPTNTETVNRTTRIFSPSIESSIVYFDPTIERVPLDDFPPMDVNSILYHNDARLRIPITDHFEAVMLAVSALRIAEINAYPALVHPISDYTDISANVAVSVPSNESGTIQTFFLDKNLPSNIKSIEIIDDMKAVGACYALLAKGLVGGLVVKPTADAHEEEIPLMGIESSFADEDIMLAARSNYYWPGNKILGGILVQFKQKLIENLEAILDNEKYAEYTLSASPEDLADIPTNLLVRKINEATKEISNSN